MSGRPGRGRPGGALHLRGAHRPLRLPAAKSPSATLRTLCAHALGVHRALLRVAWLPMLWTAGTDAYLHLNRLGNDEEPLPGQV